MPNAQSQLHCWSLLLTDICLMRRWLVNGYAYERVIKATLLGAILISSTLASVVFATGIVREVNLIFIGPFVIAFAITVILLYALTNLGRADDIKVAVSIKNLYSKNATKVFALWVV